MASLQQRSGWFHLLFRYQGRQHSHALKTKDRREAEAYRGSVDRMLIRLRNREIPSPPPEADLAAFLLTGGQRVEEAEPAEKPLTLGELRNRYLDTHGNGALEQTSLHGMRIHFKHFIKHFGERQEVVKLTPSLLQGYVDARCRQKGKKNRPLSTTTVTKELGTLRAAWNWSVRGGTLTGSFPGRALIYPKSDEQPGFQTWSEIERKIARGGLTEEEIGDLWACLFLTRPELNEFLSFAQATAREPYLFPMLAFAGHTGARRSELIRLRIDDVDFEAGMALIRECKKRRGQRTTRRVPLSGFLKQVLHEWLSQHPGGQMLFARSRLPGEEELPLSPRLAYIQFRRLVRGTKWNVLRGWHVLRHSFISICAGEGVDQRVLQGWVGHLSAATHKRYTHLIPSKEQEIIGRVFG
jgi:integrase